VETTETFDDLRSVKDPQVVCIGKHNLRAGGCDLIGQNALDRCLSSHRHERWRFDLTVRGHKPTTPRAAAGGQELVMQAAAGRPGGERIRHRRSRVTVKNGELSYDSRRSVTLAGTIAKQNRSRAFCFRTTFSV
jgi:hypothetical protein